MPPRAAACLLLAAVLWPGSSWASQRVVEELRGTVDDASYPRFERFVTGHLDQVIGLRLDVQSSSDGHVSVSGEDGQFVISRTTNAADEIVASSGYGYLHGAYRFDGFFIVKSGGIHQGVMSYGLLPVSEALVRLNAAVRIRSVRLRP